MALVAVTNRAPQLAVTKSGVTCLIASSARTVVTARGIGSDGGFSALVPRDGTRAMLADLPMGGFTGTGARDGVAATDLTTLRQVVLRSGLLADLPMGGFTGTGARDAVVDTELATRGQKYIATGATFARSIANLGSDIVNVKNFGALGDGVADDTAAIQACVNSLTRNSMIVFPNGVYNVSAEIALTNTYAILIFGAGFYSSKINVIGAGGLQSIFNTNNALIYDSWRFSGLGFIANGKAGSALRFEQLVHSRIDSCLIVGTTFSAIRANNGYNNTIDQNLIFSNFGNGIDIAGSNINNANVLVNQIYANSGIGVSVSGGLGVNINGNGIEGNVIAGIAAFDVRGLNIENNYFERNAATGTVFSTPEVLTVKSDICIYSSGRVIAYDPATTVDSCRIVGNHFTPYGTGNIPSAGLSIDAPIFAPVANKMTVENNQIYDTTKVSAMVAIYNNYTKANVSALRMRNNSRNDVAFVGVGVPTFSLNTAHNIDAANNTQVKNFAAQYPMAYGVIAGTTGTLVKSATNFEGYPAMDVTVGDKQWGVTIDLTVTKELQGALVWFGFYYKIQDASGTGIVLKLNSSSGTNTDNDGSITEGITATGTWVFKSVVRKLALSDTYLTYYFTRTGAAGNPVIIANPILTVVGSSQAQFQIPLQPPTAYGTAVPTTGTWAVNDRVYNSVPTVGQPKSWVCTVAGTPGTWVSEGNL